MTQKKIILDVDTGIDDALAILYAVKSKDLYVEGVTAGFGNVSAEQATLNTLKVLEVAKPAREIPVAMGAKEPLFRPAGRPPAHIHGANGIGDYDLPHPSQKSVTESAADFIVRKVNEQVNEITLVTVGRMTNLALALEKDPTVAEKVKEVIFMGGALKTYGNVTPVAEANIYGDPEAAHCVFESGIPLTMVGLDVTRKAGFTDSHLAILMEKMPEDNKELKAFVKHLFEFGISASEKMNEGKQRLMHDPLAIGVAIDPTFIQTEEHRVFMETKGTLSAGATLADLRHPAREANVSVGVKVDVNKFLAHFIHVLSSNE